MAFPASTNPRTVATRGRRSAVRDAVLGLVGGPGVFALNLWTHGKDLSDVSLTTWALTSLVGAFVFLIAGRVPRVVHRPDSEEQALIERAASGDEGAAQELVARDEQERATLREQALSSRRAARKYHDRLKLEIEALQQLERDSVLRDDRELIARLHTDLRRLEQEMSWAASRR